MHASEPILRLRDLAIHAGSRTLLQGVALDLAAGDVLLVLGATGAGKSTLLDAVSGMSRHRVEGTVQLGGADLLRMTPARVATERRTRLGVLPQDLRAAFTPYRRIGSQLLESLGPARDAVRGRLEALLPRMALAPWPLLGRFPCQVSDGMLRRAALAGVLARGPALIVADEPTAGLDGPGRWRAWELLIESGASVLAATHDVALAAALCRLPAAGPGHPASRIRAVRVLDGRVVEVPRLEGGG